MRPFDAECVPLSYSGEPARGTHQAHLTGGGSPVGLDSTLLTRVVTADGVPRAVPCEALVTLALPIE